MRQPGRGWGIFGSSAREAGQGREGLGSRPALGERGERTGGRRGGARARQATRALLRRRPVSHLRRRQCLPVRAAPCQLGQGRRRGVPEHGPQFSMMDSELPPPGLPSQQVLPSPRGPTVVPEGRQGREGAAARDGQPQPAFAVCGRSRGCRSRTPGPLPLRQHRAGTGSGDSGGRPECGGAAGGPTDSLPATPEGDCVVSCGGGGDLRLRAWGEQELLAASWAAGLGRGWPSWTPSSSGSGGRRGRTLAV